MKPQHWIATDTGVVRKHNEDAFLWLGPDDTFQNGYLWLIADGMGGESAGELAAKTVVQAVREIYPVAIKRGNDPWFAIEQALGAANKRIQRIQRERPELAKMGTTAVVAALYQGKFYISHIGDSRAYIHRGAHLQQITTDHTKLQTMLDMGVIQPENALNHPAGHVLVRVIGRPNAEVDHGGKRAIPAEGATLLLCSDGLCGYVPEDEIERATNSLYARDATMALLEVARRYKSQDNTTIAVIRTVPPDSTSLTTMDAFLKTVEGPSGVAFNEPPTLAPVQRLDSASTDDSQGRPAAANVTVDRIPGLAARPKDIVASQTERIAKVQGQTDPTRVPRRTTTQRNAAAGQRTEARPLPGATMRSAPAQPRRGQTTGQLNTSQRATGRTASPGTANHLAVGTPAPQARRTNRPSPGLSSLAAEDVAKIAAKQSAKERQAQNPQRRVAAKAEPHAGEAGRRSQYVAIVIALSAVLAIVLILAVVKLSTQAKDDDTRAEQTDLIAANEEGDDDNTVEADATDNEPIDLNTRATAPSWRDLPRERRPDEPSDPAKIVAPDGMPLYLAGDDQNGLYIDAHEVTVGQFRLVLQDSQTLQILHRETDAPRYRDAACSPGVSTDDVNPDQPICVSAESARHYCFEVGRRLPARADWRRIFAVADPIVSRGNGHLAMFSSDGSAPPVQGPDRIDGVYGVFDGYPEVLMSSELDSARGDIPVLGSTNAASDAFGSDEALPELGVPLSIQGGLETRFRSDTLDASARVQIGFRCVVDADDYDGLRAFDPEAEPSQEREQANREPTTRPRTQPRTQPRDAQRPAPAAPAAPSAAPPRIAVPAVPTPSTDQPPASRLTPVAPREFPTNRARTQPTQNTEQPQAPRINGALNRIGSGLETSDP